MDFLSGVMTVGSYDKTCRQGLAALLTALLGAGTLAQAEEAARGKVEASAASCSPKDHADQFTSWKAPARTANAPTPWQKIRRWCGALGRLSLLQAITTSRAATSMR